jgi:hypothetical protein
VASRASFARLVIEDTRSRGVKFNENWAMGQDAVSRWLAAGKPAREEEKGVELHARGCVNGALLEITSRE